MPYQFSSFELNQPTMGIYVHVPFCARKCNYCDFYSLAPGSDWDRRGYQEAVTSWLGCCADHYAEDRVVDTVYFGGGTPSCYDAEKLMEIVQYIRTWFTLSHDCEITVECNPDSATERWLQTMKKAGANRLSMGVQSANDEELRLAGRLHDFATAIAAFRRAREVGFDNISLDLIYGLPGQTMQSWQHSVEELIALAPEHLSCYGLKVEPGTPFWQQREMLDLPDDDVQADMYLWMVERLEQAGYGQYEVSNFAKPGRHSRHNMRYWLGQEYLGVGPGAHSYVDDERYAFTANLEDFFLGVYGPWQNFTCESRRIDDEERTREYVMLRMRTVLGICRKEFESRFGRSFDGLEKQLIIQGKYGWAAIEDDRWHFTPEGFLLSNALIGQLLEALED